MNRRDRRAAKAGYLEFCEIIRREIGRWRAVHPGEALRFVMPPKDAFFAVAVAAVVSLIGRDEPTRTFAAHLAALGDAPGRGGATVEMLRGVLESLGMAYEVEPLGYFGRLKGFAPWPQGAPS
jgi:hypothetical protein